MEAHQIRIQSLISQLCHEEAVSESLRILAHLLSSRHDKKCELTELCADHRAAHKYFMSGPYENLLYKLLNIFCNVELYRANYNIISTLFLEGKHDVSFEVLCSGLTSQDSALTSERCLHFITDLVSFGKLSDIVKKKCADDKVMFNGEFESLIQAISSLPDRAANRFQRNVPEILQRDNYYPVVYKAILAGLHAVKSRLEISLHSSVAFISQLVGKLCMNGHAMDLWRTLLSNIMMSQDFLISRVFHKVVVGIPVKALEATIIPLLRCVHHHDDVSALLGNTIIETTRLQHLIMDKLLLQKYYTSADTHLLLYNVIGYLASSPSRVELYETMSVRLLGVWSDHSSINNIGFNQHMYVSKAVVVCAAFHKDKGPLDKDVGDELMKMVTIGLQNHLTNGDPCMRRIGMAVAEIVTRIIQPELEHKLEFEFDSNEELDILKSMLSPPSNVPTTYKLAEEEAQEETRQKKDSPSKTKKSFNVDLDSDDDLEPIGETEDKPRPSNKAPAYLGECMQGLMEDENPEKIEVCLSVASKLIRKNKTMAQEVSVEFAKILLHMGSTLAIENYMLYRHKAMISLLVMSPQPVAEYLCKEFKSRNYNVRQKLDILDALAAGAMELSDPNAVHEEKTTQLVQEFKTMSVNKKAPVPDWRAIVDARVKAKTKRFAKASHAAPHGMANRFYPVAGSFFFPLLAASSSYEGEYNPLSADVILLVQYLYTLGKITGSSLHCPLVNRIASEMLAIVWVFRSSAEKEVRKAVIFCIAMTLMVIPPTDLLNMYDLADTREHLEVLVQRDPDSSIREMAGKVLIYFHAQLKVSLDKSLAASHTQTTLRQAKAK